MPVTALFIRLLVLAVPMAVHAGSARMELTVAPGIVAEAEYWPGESELPAVLLLHGFLATREFPTIRRLSEALASEGFSVLAPTLSLGVNRRRQSVACEAIHTHSMEQDVAELRSWVHWLAERAGKAPVVIGHSVGGAQLTAMLDADRDLEVARAVLVSLSSFGEEQGPEEVGFLRARAATDQARAADAMYPYSLSYCKTYVTTPSNLLSYLTWDKARLMFALNGSAVPVTVIYGDRDERIDKAWIENLRSGGVAVRPVAGANHFFDLAHEFDLLDEVLRVISEGSHG
ncbi:MAG: alpha/beta fold hydrolase [Chromatiaceae bacterium]|nr:alpha/beta fold hydrolase [Chromatiaceae bacterium]